MSGWGAIYDNMMFGLRTHSQTLSHLQEQVSSGLRVIRPSDDPSAAFQIMNLRGEQHSLGTYTRNLNRVTTNLESASLGLQEISDALVGLKGDITQMLSDTFVGQREGYVANLDVLVEGLVSAANREVLGQYLFGGDGNTPPYQVERADGRIVSVRYVGGPQPRSAAVGPGMVQPVTLVGEEMLRCDNRGEPTFSGETGAAVGAGTSSIRGNALLEIRHDTTTYGGATGVAAGAGSAAGDTILGTGHKLTIDADAATVTLDDGVAVSFGGGGDDSNIRLTNAAGDVVYVDLTDLDGGLAGTVEVDITATGQMSIDGGETFSPLATFTDHERAVDPITGRVLYVDATQIERVGDEAVHAPGTYDLFEMLISIRDALLNDRGLSDAEQTDLLGKCAEALDEVMGRVTRSSTSLGARLSVMDRLQQNLEDRAADVDANASQLQDADVIELATELTRTQTYYEMILTATVKVLNMSLLDYL